MLKNLYLSVLLFSVAGSCSAVAGDDFIALYAGASRFSVLQNDNSYMDLEIGGWGKNWSWLSWKVDTIPDSSKLTMQGKSGSLAVSTVITPAANGYSASAALKASEAGEVTLIMLAATFPGIEKGTWTARDDKGAEAAGELPFQRDSFSGLGAIAGIEITPQQGEAVRLTLTPAIPVPVDRGQLRLQLAAGKVEPGRDYNFSLKVELPGRVTVYTDPESAPGTPDFDKWYAFEGTGHPTQKSYLDMGDWSPEPAGAKGRVEMVKDKLLYGGQPIKLWGLNLCYADCAPSKEVAEQRAALYRRYGINTVRLHKYADGSGWQGILSKEDAASFDPEGLDRMDYFVAKLKEAGIFVKLSPIFYVKPRKENQSEIPYFSEFEVNRNGVAQTGGGAMYLGSELQDLQIRQITNLLQHRNPYTGMTYAQDPAIAVVEITNEDSILFYGTLRAMQSVPTLRARAGKAFSAWLKQKYGSKEKLLAAWGQNMLGNFRAEKFPEESWEKEEIYPIGNPWFFSPNQLEGSQKSRSKRLLDTVEFLSQLQDEVYDRMSAAIREAGYEGALVASNWQAGDGASHYANLLSDAKIGIVDRHNYFGGGSSTLIDNAAMVSTPGSGTLSSAFQQVGNRPFMISEWIHVLPNEWGAEGPALIGAYGMGLQGWDVSYMFQNRDTGSFKDFLLPGRNRVWEVTTPQILGTFPAVARMVRRGDVQEARNTLSLKVHMPSWLAGDWKFRDLTTQQHDIKSFTTDVVPGAALAVSRVAVEFTETAQQTPVFDATQHTQDGFLVSDTGQLRWKQGENPRDGYVIIDTPATAALVGFAQGQTADMKEAQITSRSRFATIFLTARNLNGSLATDREVLISAIARCRNQGANYLVDKIIQNFGSEKGPLVMEPVTAEITLRRKDAATVHVLDHDGVKTGRTIPWNGGSFQIDTARDGSPYYLVEYGE